MLVGRQTAVENLAEPASISRDHRLGIEPEAGEDSGAKETVGIGGQLDEFSVPEHEPEQLVRVERNDSILDLDPEPARTRRISGRDRYIGLPAKPRRSVREPHGRIVDRAASARRTLARSAQLSIGLRLPLDIKDRGRIVQNIDAGGMLLVIAQPDQDRHHLAERAPDQPDWACRPHRRSARHDSPQASARNAHGMSADRAAGLPRAASQHNHERTPSRAHGRAPSMHDMAQYIGGQRRGRRAVTNRFQEIVKHRPLFGSRRLSVPLDPLPARPPHRDLKTHPRGPALHWDERGFRVSGTAAHPLGDRSRVGSCP